jgi:amidohydrolase
MYSEKIKNISNEIFHKLVSIRRDIHMNPELAFEEYRTADLIHKYLKDLSIEHSTQIAKTGIVGIIPGRHPGKTIALRADMDALPVNEENDIDYKSRIPGKMHACGHDVHITCLLGAAEILKRLQDDLCGNVKLIFQPAEEGVGGALPMIEEGILDHPSVDACVAAHAWSDVPVGKVLVKYGPIMASPDEFEIIIKGKGSHGAMPHTAVDPIIIGCQVVNALQTIVSRRFDPLDPIALSICYFHAGTCENVIPDNAVIKGTVRTFDIELRKKAANLIEEITSGIVKSMGGEYEFLFKYLYPPTVNDKKITDILAQSASKIIGNQNIMWGDRPSMGGEDFAYFAERVPSTYFRLGCGNPEKGLIHPIHNSKFDVDEECIKIGAAILAQCAMDYTGMK